ncbi:MAG: hypothetical protein CHACPFDD_01205 [Phycisphaerae bacterium]|nr:hypothetical protein [Phycisphaerae bacterium]
MKPETLEQLLIDRALGTLSPEVGELVEAYVRSDEAATRAASAFAETARLAREAIGTSEARTPAFPAERIRTAAARRRLMQRASAGLSMAACVVLGLGAGWLWFARDVAGRVGDRPATAPAVAVSLAAGRERTADGMWNLDRIVRTVGGRAVRGESAGKLKWTSPIERPRYHDGI